MNLLIFRKIIFINELGGNKDFLYRFSDPDGRAGRSGYSFGLCQFDVSHNPEAVLCLRECEFTTDEIAGLKSQAIDAESLEWKLAENKQVVDRWDNRQIDQSLTHPVDICIRSGIDVEEKAMYHLADYHNQFYMSKGGKMHRFLLALQRPVTPEDILNLKLHTQWGKLRSGDVHRRYNNIVAILGD
jgi:hypothetical protein